MTWNLYWQDCQRCGSTFSQFCPTFYLFHWIVNDCLFLHFFPNCFHFFYLFSLDWWWLRTYIGRTVADVGQQALGHAEIAIWDQNDISAPPANFNGKYVNSSYHRMALIFLFIGRKSFSKFLIVKTESKCPHLKDWKWSSTLNSTNNALISGFKGFGHRFDLHWILSKQKPKLVSS